jgi:DNA repair protein RadC
MRLCDMTKSLRPREKAFAHGVESLSDEELLALILRSGTSGKNVLELSSELLREHGGLAGVARGNAESFSERDGISKVKAVELLGVFELAKRLERSSFDEAPSLKPAALYARFRLSLASSGRESLILILADGRNRFIREKIIYCGTENGVMTVGKEIIQEALAGGASGFILIHNHPSGNVLPSTSDFAMTKRLKEVGFGVGIRLLDHLIVGEKGYYSFNENGILAN